MLSASCSPRPRPGEEVSALVRASAVHATPAAAVLRQRKRRCPEAAGCCDGAPAASARARAPCRHLCGRCRGWVSSRVLRSLRVGVARFRRVRGAGSEATFRKKASFCCGVLSASSESSRLIHTCAQEQAQESGIGIGVLALRAQSAGFRRWGCALAQGFGLM